MAVIGYARVSTREQNPQAQAAELRAAGCRIALPGTSVLARRYCCSAELVRLVTER
ncbi:recombinase family protein [Glutamicibacter ardleyensis]|uniref:recombinase family protein n=1 Tax=Glutamicibacter ardleyensis TaxID=225894 RepID=UPI001E2E156C|nr:recombinase family protein [Glutamicibacter ardleyensis]